MDSLSSMYKTIAQYIEPDLLDKTFIKFKHCQKRYLNDHKFSDKHVWANSADPDQTAPNGAV